MARAISQVVLCTSGYDHTIKFWEATTANCERTIQYAESQVNALAITPDKHYVAAAGKHNVRLFDISSNHPNPVLTFEGHTGNVTAVGFQKDRKWMFTSSEDGTVKIWDPRSGGSFQRDYQSKSPMPAINTVVLHPNQGELISGDEEGNIYVWDLTDNQCVCELVPDGKVPVRSITIASDASLVMAANNRGTVFSWKLEAHGFEALQKIEAHNTHILKVLLAPDIKSVATASADKTIKIFDVQNNLALVKTLQGHRRWVWDLAFSADSQYLVSGSSDCTARLWGMETGKCIFEYTGHQKAVTCVALNDASD